MSTAGDTRPFVGPALPRLGHETIVYATAGDEKLVAIFDPHDAPRAGEAISFSVTDAKLHLFDATSETALR